MNSPPVLPPFTREIYIRWEVDVISSGNTGTERSPSSDRTQSDQLSDAPLQVNRDTTILDMMIQRKKKTNIMHGMNSYFTPIYWDEITLTPDDQS